MLICYLYLDFQMSTLELETKKAIKKERIEIEDKAYLKPL